MFEVFGIECEDFETLVDIVTEELTKDDTYVDEVTGKLETIGGVEDLYDFCIDSVSGDVDGFIQMLDEMGNHFDGIHIDTVGRYDDAMSFYNSTRF